MKRIIIIGLIIAAGTAFGFVSTNQEMSTGNNSIQHAQVIKGADKLGYSESNMDSW